MPLIFSPLSEELIELPPQKLFPRHAFLMRQIGDPPDIDRVILEAVTRVCQAAGFQTKDAASSTGGKDFLERILSLIRGTGFTIAIFSHATRQTAMANIALELGFAAMCGKPLLIVKSREAVAPSDLTRTDWIEFTLGEEQEFEEKLGQALAQVDDIASYQETLLQIALDAPAMDCAVALERATKAFLLSGDQAIVEALAPVEERLRVGASASDFEDMKRLHREVATFMRQGRQIAAR